MSDERWWPGCPGHTAAIELTAPLTTTVFANEGRAEKYHARVVQICILVMHRPQNFPAESRAERLFGS